MPYQKPYAPRTLQRMYDQLSLADETVCLLHDYLEAAANFYYVIPLAEVYAQFRQNHPELHITDQELGQFTAIVRREQQPYRILSTTDFYDDLEARDTYDLVINDALLDSPTPGGEGDEDFYDLFEVQEPFDYQNLDEAHFLRYCEDDYYDVTPEVQRMREFLRDRLNLSRISADQVILMFYDNSRLLWDDAAVFMEPIFYYLMEELRLDIDDGTLEELMELSLDMITAWPHPALSGHTMKEFEKQEREHALIKDPIPIGPEVRSLIQNHAIDVPHYLADLVLAYGLPKDVRDSFIDQVEALLPEKERLLNQSLFQLLRDERFVSMYRLTPEDWDRFGGLYGIPFPNEMAEELMQDAKAAQEAEYEEPVESIARRAPKRGKLIN